MKAEKRKYAKQIEMDEMADYASRFKSMRKGAGLSQRQISYLLKVHESTYRRWERGQSVPQKDIKDIENRFKNAIG